MEEKLIELKAIVSKLPHGPIPSGLRGSNPRTCRSVLG